MFTIIQALCKREGNDILQRHRFYSKTSNSYLHESTVGVFCSAKTRFQARAEAEAMVILPYDTVAAREGGASGAAPSHKFIKEIRKTQGLSELADQNNTVNSSSSGNNRKNVQKNLF
jgi:crotonobetainyl-CoA:carnitine CoA-transferase CaiB-like acyl-CoA transferase